LFRKSCKNPRSVGGSAPKLPFASGGCSRIVIFSSYYAVATFYKRLVLMLTRFIIDIKEQNALTFRFLMGAQKYFCSLGHKVPSYAIGNMTSLNVTSVSPPNVFSVGAILRARPLDP